MREFTETAARLERVTGLYVSVERQDREEGWGYFIYGCPHEAPPQEPQESWVISLWSDSLLRAQADFITHNLKRIRLDLMQEQNGRCGICQRAVPLQLHHKVFRSQGRDDRKSNLHLICFPCHNGSHGGR